MKKRTSPDLPLLLGSYGRRLAEENGLDLARWCLVPGMLFGADRQWWGKGGRRPRPHEGIDLVLYRNGRGETVRLKKSLKIPVAAPGRIAAVVDDFLGRSIFVRHESIEEEEGELFTLYGHLAPLVGIVAGRELATGEGMATLAEGENPVPGLFPHLHFSIARLPRGIPAEELNWDGLTRREEVVFLDPLAVLDDYSIVTVLEEG